MGFDPPSDETSLAVFRAIKGRAGAGPESGTVLGRVDGGGAVVRAPGIHTFSGLKLSIVRAHLRCSKSVHLTIYHLSRY